MFCEYSGDEFMTWRLAPSLFFFKAELGASNMVFANATPKHAGDGETHGAFYLHGYFGVCLVNFVRYGARGSRPACYQLASFRAPIMHVSIPTALSSLLVKQLLLDPYLSLSYLSIKGFEITFQTSSVLFRASYLERT